MFFRPFLYTCIVKLSLECAHPKKVAKTIVSTERYDDYGDMVLNIKQIKFLFNVSILMQRIPSNFLDLNKWNWCTWILNSWNINSWKKFVELHDKGAIDKRK